MSANPTDLVGAKKVDLTLFPPAGLIYGALGFQNGAQKFGSYNWRTTKVGYMTYLAAIKRHVEALLDGENNAEDSGLHHLCHIIANGALMADALEGGWLIDNRPPKGPAAKLLKKHDRSVVESETQVSGGGRFCVVGNSGASHNWTEAAAVQAAAHPGNPLRLQTTGTCGKKTLYGHEGTCLG